MAPTSFTFLLLASLVTTATSTEIDVYGIAVENFQSSGSLDDVGILIQEEAQVINTLIEPDNQLDEALDQLSSVTGAIEIDVVVGESDDAKSGSRYWIDDEIVVVIPTSSGMGSRLSDEEKNEIKEDIENQVADTLDAMIIDETEPDKLGGGLLEHKVEQLFEEEAEAEQEFDQMKQELNKVLNDLPNEGPTAEINVVVSESDDENEVEMVNDEIVVIIPAATGSGPRLTEEEKEELEEEIELEAADALGKIIMNEFVNDEVPEVVDSQLPVAPRLEENSPRENASSSSTSINRSQPPPPKSPVHRTATGNVSINELARPPTGGSVGYMGFDRLMMMRQVNAAAAPATIMQVGNGGDEASAAVNHRQRMAAEQQRRMELSLMAKEDYTGTLEGQERLQRQEERSRMREEELFVLRLIEAEKEAARKLQRGKELEEEKRVKEQYLAKIRAQREQQEREAKEKEEARKAEMERKMKALKEAADAKARAEFAAKQHAIEEEARIVRENLQIEVENVQMQVEDVLGHAMQQEWIAERERQRQIAAEQEEWRLFQEREQEKQREATQLRRAAMAQQYEQDKQRRIQIHRLQKERAAQQAERREMQNRHEQELQAKKDEANPESESADEGNFAKQDTEDNPPSTAAPDEEKSDDHDPKDESLTANDNVGGASDEVPGNHGDNLVEVANSGDVDNAKPPGESVTSVELEQEKQKDQIPLVELNESAEKIEGEEQTEKDSNSAVFQDNTNSIEQEVKEQDPCVSDIAVEASTADKVDEVTTKPDQEEPDSVITPLESEDTDEDKVEQEADDVSSRMPAIDELVVDISPDLFIEDEKPHEIRAVWSISAAREHGLVPFAQVLSVTDNSPAMQATLKSGDLLIEFGGIVSTTPKCLMTMAECVQKNVNTSISVVILRPKEATPDENFEEVRVSLCPRKWKGKGLLGCQLSPFKWPDEAEKVDPQKPEENEMPIASMENTCSDDDGASALVMYDIVPASIADQAGLLNGDILTGCEGLEISVNVANLSEVAARIQATRASCSPVHLDINRWVDEDQCYRSLRIELPADDGSGPLGFALTSFAEYYNYYTSTTAAVSACEECYYTTLTTALHAAALSGHVSCLEALLNSLQNGDGGGYSASDYLDWRDEDGRTPLFYACYAGQVECVRYLLKTTQSVSNEFVTTGVDLYGDTVLHAATTSGNTAVIALLLESGCVKVDDRNHTCLTCAHVAPNVEVIAFLGEQFEADLLATDAEERMPLAYACLRNDVESIQYLCRKHPDFVDYADVRGNTPLHVAGWLGLQEAAEVLITFLPSIALFITNEDDQNAAELARSSGMEEVAIFLESVIAAADSNIS